MSEDVRQSGDERLAKLLRIARPAAELPPGFQNNVWRRIEKSDQPSVGILEQLAGWFLTPRLATAGLTVVILLAAGAGALHGMRNGQQEARDNYVASVDPSYSHR